MCLIPAGSCRRTGSIESVDGLRVYGGMLSLKFLKSRRNEVFLTVGFASTATWHQPDVKKYPVYLFVSPHQVSLLRWFHRLPRTTWGQLRNEKITKQRSINHSLTTWIIFFSWRHYLAKWLTVWVMEYKGFLLCHSLKQQTLLYSREVTQTRMHTASCIRMHATLELSMITWWEQGRTVSKNIRLRDWLPRMKISQLCYLGKGTAQKLKRRTETSVLKGTHWRMKKMTYETRGGGWGRLEEGGNQACRLRGHVSEWLSFLWGFLFGPFHVALFTQTQSQFPLRCWS